MEELKYRYDSEREKAAAKHGGATSTGPPQSKAALALVWVALVATIACNGLFEWMRLGGVTSAEVSNEVFAWFAPAGYVFAIWGVIYAALALWAIVATVKGMKQQTVTMRQAVFFAVSAVLNIGWLAAFHFKMIDVSVVLIIALWCVVFALYSTFSRPGSPLWAKAPFALYFGWLCVAVVANIAHLATRMFDIPLIVNQVSVVVAVVVLLIVAYAVARTRDDWVFPLVVLWAAIGVGVHLMAADMAISTALFALSAAGALAIYIPLGVEKYRSGRRAVSSMRDT